MKDRLLVSTRVTLALFLATILSGTAPAATALAAPGNGKAYGHAKANSKLVINNENQNSYIEANASQRTVAHTETPSNSQKVQSEKTIIPGNNGTVKIDRLPFDSHPNNQPHVGCTFQVDFYNYDKGVGNALVKFELHAPTNKDQTLTVASGNLTPNIGEDAAGGGKDIDAQETYTLAFTGEPHTKQGYHVKMTVYAPGSQGANVKHKVFWVKSCKQPVKLLAGGQGGGQVLGDTTTATPTGLLANTGENGNPLLNVLVCLAILSAAYLSAKLTRKPQI